MNANKWARTLLMYLPRRLVVTIWVFVDLVAPPLYGLLVGILYLIGVTLMASAVVYYGFSIQDATAYAMAYSMVWILFALCYPFFLFLGWLFIGSIVDDVKRRYRRLDNRLPKREK